MKPAVKTAGFVAAMLLGVAVGRDIGFADPPPAATPRVAAVTWTRYDWNASVGKGGDARFEVGADGALFVEARTPDDARFVRTVPVDADALYRVAGRVRTEGVGAAARGAGLSALGILDGSADVQGTSGWRAVELYGRTGPSQRELSVTVGVGGYGSLNVGRAWFDGVTVERVGGVPPGVRVASLAPPPVPASTGGFRSGWLFGAVAALGLGLLIAGRLLARRGSRPGDGQGLQTEAPFEAVVPPGLDRIDAGVLIALTTLCLVVSLWNLGGHTAPETGWQPARPGETVTVELGREVDLSRIYYYAGINEAAGEGSRFTLSARAPGGGFAPVAGFRKDDVGTWKYVDVDVRTSAVQLIADTPGGRLNELAFLEKGRLAPVAGLHIGTLTVSAGDRGTPAALIDEPGAFELEPSFRTGFYFDEIYFARTAWETLHGIEPYETTHPPLGKLFIAAGVRLFGMNPFGWRVAGALFGVALVPLLYLLARKLFRHRFYAFVAAFLLAVDFMRFAQTRVAVIDVYGVFFILLLYYFVLDLFPRPGSPPPRTERSLLLAGLAFGLGAACKWIAVYAGAGAALLIAVRTAADLRGQARIVRFLARRAAVCLVAFGVVPAAIYLLSYATYLSLPGPGHDLAGVLRLQEHMLDYHRTLQATHPFSSPWWSWPLDLHPMWMYLGQGLPEGRVSHIASFGNPALWWPAIPAAAGAAVLALRRRDARLGVVLTALAFQYAPWVGIHRLAFIYHFFSVIPFVILCIAALLEAGERRFPRLRPASWGYLGVAGTLFLVFYPVLSGLEVRGGYVAALQWLPTWIF
ncbi:MAG: phospholipid carrier-dependent glycosyltransferase [Deltaproteobacteria bacterium]|nr:phospholipid carrier-dependent glycosyltransferase [Deltaproteobacteria bacterium]